MSTFMNHDMEMAWIRVMESANPVTHTTEEIMYMLSMDLGMEEYSFRVARYSDTDEQSIEVREGGQIRHIIDVPKPTTIDYMEASIGKIMGESEEKMGP